MSALPEVNLNTVVTTDDLEEGQEWPPRRYQDRDERMTLQHEVSRADYSRLLDKKDQKRISVCANRIGDYIDQVTGLLLFTADELPLDIQSTIEGVAADSLKHGRGIVIRTDDQWIAEDIRFAWPMEGNAWAFVEPYYTAQAQDNKFDAIRIIIWEDGELGGFLHEWTGQQIGPQIEVLEPAAAQLAVVDRAPISRGWGTPHVDTLVPLALEMAKRESGISYVINRNERSPIALKVTEPDTRAIIREMNADIPESSEYEAKPSELKKQFNEIMEEEWIFMPKTVDQLQHVINEMNIDQSFTFVQRLDTLWTSATGFAPIEAADAGTMSGIAYARRNWNGSAKTARLYNAIRAALQALGMTEDWPYILSAEEMSDPGESQSTTGEPQPTPDSTSSDPDAASTEGTE